MDVLLLTNFMEQSSDVFASHNIQSYDVTVCPDRLGGDSSVGIALGYGLDDRGSRVRFPAGLGIFLFITASRTFLGPTQPPIQWVTVALSLGVKRPVRETDHSPPSSAEAKEWVELCLHSQYSFMAWCSFKKNTGTTLHTHTYMYIYRKNI
jgi:hypothetical protein